MQKPKPQTPMKKYLISILLTGSLSANAQKIFSVPYGSQADVKVYVVKYESQADLKVFKVPYESKAKGNDGNWFFTKYPSQAKKKIFFVSHESQADLKIFFVGNRSQAGWRKREKLYVMEWRDACHWINKPRLVVLTRRIGFRNNTVGHQTK